MNSPAETITEDKPTRTRKAPKTQQLIALLSRPGGSTTAELTGAMGLLPHSARAALTGLRKKGHSITKSTRNGASCYSLLDASK